MSARVCNVPGCPTISDGPRCPTHAKAAERARGTARQRGYGNRWARHRARQLRRHPWCEQCGAPATDVDHIDGMGPLGSRGYDPSNLRSLCHPCHSRHTAAEQPGGWNALG